MPTGSLEHVLGRSPARAFASGFAAGILFALAARVAFATQLAAPEPLGTAVVVATIGGGVVLVVLTAVVQRGGVLPAWLGVAPGIAVVSRWSVTTDWPTAVLVSGLVVATLYLLLSIGVYGSLAAVLPGVGDRRPDREGDAGGQSAPSLDGTQRDELPRSRRRILLWSSGTATLGAVWLAHEYGWTCRASPADCTVENTASRPMEFTVTVERHGLRIFRETGSLGTIDDSQFHDDASLEPRSRSFRRAVPIGCRLPQELQVTVTTDEYGSASERVTVPHPDPPATATVGPATLAIEIGENGVAIDPRYTYGVP